jgi:hypothetical protein
VQFLAEKKVRREKKSGVQHRNARFTARHALIAEQQPTRIWIPMISALAGKFQ